MMHSRHGRAFTLIEVLIVTALFAALGLAVFTCLSSGLKLWDRANRIASDEDAVIFFDRFDADVKNAFVSSQVAAKGSEISFCFPTIVLAEANQQGRLAEEGFLEQMGSVEYRFDPASRLVSRSQGNYAQSLLGKLNDPQAVLGGVDELRFRYFYAGRREYSSSVSGQSLPSAVEIEVRFSGGVPDKSGLSSPPRIFKRFITIPSGE